MKLPRWLVISMLVASSLAVLAFVGWWWSVMWPEIRAVMELRHSVERSDPNAFLDAIHAVETLGVTDKGANEVSQLSRHPQVRVRMYALIALTVLSPRTELEAQELIRRFDDPTEDVEISCAAAYCLAFFGENARGAIPSLARALSDINDPRCHAARSAFLQLGSDITGPLPRRNYLLKNIECFPITSSCSATKIADDLIWEADTNRRIEVSHKTLFSRD